MLVIPSLLCILITLFELGEINDLMTSLVLFG